MQRYLSDLKRVFDSEIMKPFNDAAIKFGWYRKFPNASINFLNKPSNQVEISVGDMTWGEDILLLGCHEKSGGRTTLDIGARTYFGPHVTIILANNHEMHNPSKILQHNGNTNIGNDVWIGYGAVIMPNIKIGDNAVIGAGAIVTHNVNPFDIVAGVPAKSIKKNNYEW